MDNINNNSIEHQIKQLSKDEFDNIRNVLTKLHNNFNNAHNNLG